jgi:aspartyl-tRNA(Asn)/glutamyl-tRNA(Gln) amidotransferase subunit A
MTELTYLTIAQIRDGFRAGDFSARDVAEGFNANVAAAKLLNAFIVETPDHALAAADAADKDRAAGTLKPLSGVPIGMKDLFATKGVQTTAASHILEGFVPEYESSVSQKLWDAGAGMLGKLNMDQFAMGSSNETSYFGNVISPWRRGGGAMRRSRRGALRADQPRQLPRISARGQPARTRADRSVSQPLLRALRGSSPLMAAARAGALSRLLLRSIRPGQWRARAGLRDFAGEYGGV